MNRIYFLHVFIDNDSTQNVTSLMWLKKSRNKRIEVEQEKLVYSNKSRDKVDEHDLDLKALVRRFKLLEHFLSQA